MDRAAVKFCLPFGDLFLHVPSTTDALLVAPLAVEHVLIELRTQQGELLSAAAYRDIQALMGREAPIVWARGARGELVRVTAHTRASLTDQWWDSVLQHFAPSADQQTREGSASASHTLPEGVEFLGCYASIHAYMKAMLEPEVTPACAWILDHLDYQAVQRKWEEDGSRLIIEQEHIYRLPPPVPEDD
jgi:hypothetical protein